MTPRSFDEFLSWEQSSRDTIDVKKIYIDMAGDLMAGVMLSQIVYWHLPSRNGDSKLRITREGSDWLVKSYSQWWDEIRMTEDQARRALKILKEKDLVNTKVWRFAGSPTMHIRISDHFMTAFEAQLDLGHSPSTPSQQPLDLGHSPFPPGIEPATYTESTAETTSKLDNSTHVPSSNLHVAPAKKEQREAKLSESGAPTNPGQAAVARLEDLTEKYRDKGTGILPHPFEPGHIGRRVKRLLSSGEATWAEIHDTLDCMAQQAAGMLDYGKRGRWVWIDDALKKYREEVASTPDWPEEVEMTFEQLRQAKLKTFARLHANGSGTEADPWAWIHSEEMRYYNITNEDLAEHLLKEKERY